MRLRKLQELTGKVNMIKFEGIDYAEIAEHFNIPIKDDQGDHEAIAAWLADHAYDKYMRPNAEIVRVLRDWLAQFIPNDGTNGTELWKGLARIKDDWYFLRYFTHLMGYMWT